MKHRKICKYCSSFIFLIMKNVCVYYLKQDVNTHVFEEVERCNSERRNGGCTKSTKCGDKLHNNRSTLIRWMNGQNERGEM